MQFQQLVKMNVRTALVLVLALLWFSAECSADPMFYSTNDPTGHWFVSTAQHNGTGDGLQSSFNTDSNNFVQAVSVTNRGDYIANNATGTNGWMGDWVFFIFRQTFDLTGYDAASADLQFQWAADDSGEGFADRGTWIPKFSLNGGSFIEYPGSPTPTYNYSSVVDLSSGFVSGINTIDFYVEGNAVTDGFALKTKSFTANGAGANPVPEPATMLLFGIGIAGFIVSGFRRKQK